MQSLKVGDRLEAVVEKVVFGGPGLCRTSHGVVFVDFAAPQDRIEIEISEVKKDYSRGKILRILQSSSERIEPRCSYFGRCGGCDWQHLSSEAQLKHKQTLIEELFQKNFGFTDVKPILASPDPFAYRNRIQLQVTAQGLCYSQKRSHELLSIESCPIAEDGINEQLKALQTQDLSLGRIQVTAKGFQNILDESILNEFSQVNTRQNQKLIELTLEGIRDLNFDHFIDLYCGSGNFTFPLAEAHAQTRGVAIDLDSQLINRAIDQLQQRKWSPQRLRFACASVDAAMARLETRASTLILLDPPRRGCGPTVAKYLSRIEAAGISYISCNPMTLVRDLKDIFAQSRWKITSVQPLDMFPQTSHIEVLVQLRPENPQI